jgi:hypothetical protein
MPAERPARGVEVVAITALGLAVCCGLPVLLSVGASVTVAGLGLGSWLLVVAGLVVAVSGAWWWQRRRSGCAAPNVDRPGR